MSDNPVTSPQPLATRTNNDATQNIGWGSPVDARARELEADLKQRQEGDLAVAEQLQKLYNLWQKTRVDLIAAETRIAQLEAELAGVLSERDQLKIDVAAEYAGNQHLREKCGARDGETFPDFVFRLHAELAGALTARTHYEAAWMRADARITEIRDEANETIKLLTKHNDVLEADCRTLAKLAVWNSGTVTMDGAELGDAMNRRDFYLCEPEAK